MNCQNCSKQYFCDKKECIPVKWSKTNNYGEVKYNKERHNVFEGEKILWFMKKIK